MRHTFRLALFLAFAAVALPTHRSTAQCIGDCGSDGEVTVDELILGVNVALGAAALDACPVFDADGSGDVTIDELITAVGNALNGCAKVPTPTPTAPSAATATASATATSPPQASATPTTGGSTCGDHSVTGSETCDDGNTVTNPPTDTCPADCTIITCTPSGTRHTATISFAPPAGKSVGSFTIRLEYPDGTVQIPGTAGDDSVVAAVTNLPSGTFPGIADYDYALVVGIAGTRAIPVGKAFDVQFDTCVDATEPSADQFVCVVTDAAGTNFMPIDGVTCSVAVQ